MLSLKEFVKMKLLFCDGFFNALLDSVQISSIEESAADEDFTRLALCA